MTFVVILNHIKHMHIHNSRNFIKTEFFDVRCRRTYVLNKMVSLNTLPFKDSPLSFWTDVQEYIWISSLVIITTRSLPLQLQFLMCRLSIKTKSLRLYKKHFIIFKGIVMHVFMLICLPIIILTYKIVCLSNMWKRIQNFLKHFS